MCQASCGGGVADRERRHTFRWQSDVALCRDDAGASEPALTIRRLGNTVRQRGLRGAPQLILRAVSRR